MSNTSSRFRYCTPELVTLDLKQAIDWYVSVLGAKNPWTWQDSFAAIHLGEVELYLREEKMLAPSSLYFHVHDVASLYQEITARGAAILTPLAETPWGTSEFVIVDTSSNRLRIGTAHASTHELEGFSNYKS